MQKIVKILGIFVVVMIMTNACKEDFLEQYPLDEVSDATFLTNSGDMELYLNQFYCREILPHSGMANGYDAGIFGFDHNSDNLLGKIPNKRLNGANVVPPSDGGWSYGDVRDINWFFENLKVEDADKDKEYKAYLGEAYFFRAIIYFNLVRNFGDVVWLDKTLTTESPELYGPRTPRREVILNIIKDLTKAASLLPEDVRVNGLRVNKYVALLLKARVALYEGTWEKYHGLQGDEFAVAGQDGMDLIDTAAVASKAVIDGGLYSVYSAGNDTADYYELFKKKEYTAADGVMLWKEFNKDFKVTNYRLTSLLYPNGQGITKGLADSYLCTDGQPVSSSPLFSKYDNIREEMKNRDPRFYQVIFTPDSPWEIDADGTETFDKVYKKMFKESKYNSPTGYIIRKGFSEVVADRDLTGEDTPSIHFRYEEALLIYAEARAELGTLTQADLDITINVLRDRVGMVHMTLGTSVEDGTFDDENSLSVDLQAIRRERRVELALEGYRWDDIARWSLADNLIAGKRFRGSYYDQYTRTPIYDKDSEGFIIPFKAGSSDPLANGYGFNVHRDYLLPLPQDQLNLNSNLTQNPGW
jgi:hypothetical protein